MKLHTISAAFFTITSSTSSIRRVVLAASSALLKSNNLTSSTSVDISAAGRIAKSTTARVLYSTSRSNDGSEEMTQQQQQRQSSSIDPLYPGTAVERLQNVHRRVAELSSTQPIVWNGPWENVRRKILWAGGLRDLPDATPGQGYTGHSFNDWNHVDLTCMSESIADSENDGTVQGIALGNRLGDGIRIASLPELGPGGSWSTCALGCSKEPPQDVAHVQFRARIAFKLVWVPNELYDTFVLVDDSGKLLAKGKPSEGLPPLCEREMNYKIVAGSKYAKEADNLARNVAAE